MSLEGQTVCHANLCLLTREPHVPMSPMPLNGLLNLSPANNKGQQLVEYITDNDIDVVALTETWLHKGDTIARGNMTLAGYTLHDES